MLQILSILWLASPLAWAGNDSCATALIENAWTPARILATSVSETSFFSVAVTGETLRHFSDAPQRIGADLQGVVELRPLSGTPQVQWTSIRHAAVLALSTSSLQSHGLVALLDTESRIHVFHVPGTHSLTVDLPANEFAVGLALSDAEVPRLTLFTTAGVRTVALPDSISQNETMHVPLTQPLSHLRGGFAIGGGSVVFDKHGTVFRVGQSSPQVIAELPSGIQSLSGFTSSQGVLSLWAVDSAGAVWEKKGDRVFTRCSMEMPLGVSAVQVTASAHRLMPDSLAPEDWSEGFLSRRTLRGGQWDIERVLILGSDGVVYSPFAGSALPTLSMGALAPGRISFGMERNARGLRLPPGEIGMKLDFMDQFERALGTNRYRPVDHWIRRLQNVRAIEWEPSGVSVQLEKLGAPDQLAAKLILLDAISDSTANTLLRGRRLAETAMLEAHMIARALRVQSKDYESNQPLRESIHSAIAQILDKVRPDSAELEFRDFLEMWQQTPDRTLCEAFDEYLRNHSYFWEWDFQEEPN